MNAHAEIELPTHIVQAFTHTRTKPGAVIQIK